MSDTYPKPVAIWQVGPCPSWCEFSHSDGDEPDDRQCFSTYKTVSRSLIAAIEVVYPARVQLDELRVALEQEHREAVPHIAFSYGSGLLHDDTSDGYHLTLEEGSALAEVIFALVAEARSGKLAEDRPWVAWQRTPCPAWCTDGHHDADGRGARRHTKRDREIPLSMQAALFSGGDTWSLDAVAVGMEADVREYEPRITFYRGNGRGYELTLSEAEQFAAILVELAFEGRPAPLDISALTDLPVLHIEPKAG